MKNLLNRMSLEETKLIPEGRFKGKLKGYRVEATGWWDIGRKHNDGALSILRRKVDSIIAGSVGQSWNNIYSKLCKLMRGVRYEVDLDWFLSDILKPYWNVREERWYAFRGWGHHFDLFEAVKRVKKQITWKSLDYPRFTELYWICPYTGRLMYVKERPRPSLTEEQVREIHRKRLRRRALRKEWRRERKAQGLAQLTMINKPDLYKFYVKLVTSYKQAVGKATQNLPIAPVYKPFNIIYMGGKLHRIPYERSKYEKDLERWRWSMNWTQSEKEKGRKEMAKLKPQIEALERGEFDIFFESDVYLYSQQKECHHFEQP